MHFMALLCVCVFVCVCATGLYNSLGNLGNKMHFMALLCVCVCATGLFNSLGNSI